MPIKENFQLYAKYNQWMNSKIYPLVLPLSSDDLKKDRGAFFGSILGTLNHLLVADLAWLNRIASFPEKIEALVHMGEYPRPTALNQILFGDIHELYEIRKQIDDVFVALCAELDERHLEGSLTYKNMKGETMSKKLSLLLQHVFNHQTHHRGQLTTLLSQMGMDFGATDLLLLIDND